jgi:hypothetical protein
MKLQQQNSFFYDEVEWLDTDASEDEDYLPQFPVQQKQQQRTSIKDYFLNKDTISGSSFDTLDDTEDDEEEAEFYTSHINNNNIVKRVIVDTDTPCDKVRRAIDKTIDNGIERVDIRLVISHYYVINE